MILESEKKLYRRLLPMVIEMQVEGRYNNEGSTVQILALHELKTTFNDFSKTDSPLILMSDRGIHALGEYLKKYKEVEDLFTEVELEKIWKTHKKVSKDIEPSVDNMVYMPNMAMGNWSTGLTGSGGGGGAVIGGAQYTTTYTTTGTSGTSSTSGQGTLFPGQATAVQSASQAKQASLQRQIEELKKDYAKASSAWTLKRPWKMGFFNENPKKQPDDGLEKDPEDNADEHE